MTSMMHYPKMLFLHWRSVTH
uniref:Uncharacterized protein n=1 Tax=Anguilla anguilla TaxID=7936 RepID=A0A0E9PKB4_ANGAN